MGGTTRHEAWLDDPKPAKPQEFGQTFRFTRFTRCLKLKFTTSFRLQEVLPWPRNAFEQSFERMERLLLAV